MSVAVMWFYLLSGSPFLEVSLATKEILPSNSHNRCACSPESSAP